MTDDQTDAQTHDGTDDVTDAQTHDGTVDGTDAQTHDGTEPRPTFASVGGEPAAGTVPGGEETDRAGDTVLEDPGSAGDTADVGGDGQTAVTPADPAAGHPAE